MKMLEYETANPGADFDEHEKQHSDPAVHGSRPPTIVDTQEAPGSSSGLKQHNSDMDDNDETKTITSPGKGRQRRMSALRGGRKEAAEASVKVDRTDVYDAAPGAEMGRV